MGTKFWLALLLSISGCYSRPSPEADFYDDYDQPDSEDDARENELAHSIHRSKFVTKDNSETEVIRGHTAELECAVDSLGGGVIMWEHPSKDFMVVDKKIMKEEEGKYKVELITKEGYKGSRLIIHVADSDDAGWYKCTETGSTEPQIQWHLLSVKDPGEFTITGVLSPKEVNGLRGLFPRQIPTKGIYNLIDYTSTSDVSLSLSTEGAPHRIMCSFSDGHDKVWWSKGESKEIFRRRPSLVIRTRKESGTYVCHAGASKKVVEVVVQYRPEVRIEQIHLTSEQGRKEFWIRCHVDSVPAAFVSWTKNGKELAVNERGLVNVSESGEQTLQVASTSLGPEALGDFSCIATTILGSVVKTTRVTGLPCSDPQRLEPTLELLDPGVHDKTRKVELCSNDDSSLQEPDAVDNINQNFNPGVASTDNKINESKVIWKANLLDDEETGYPDYRTQKEASQSNTDTPYNYDDWDFSGNLNIKEHVHDHGHGASVKPNIEPDNQDGSAPDGGQSDGEKDERSKTAEEVVLRGEGSRRNGDLVKAISPSNKGDPAFKPQHENNNKGPNKEKESAMEGTGEKEKKSKSDASYPLGDGSRSAKEIDSKKDKGSKGRLMSSPWILILTILFLFIIACIILAVLR